ncbi:MAG: SpoIIIAH-like family protein [Candidatus Limiplasma sp.]|nr:SpoIIIAH-like family protein [Candidatus Limiplasma sp.]
MNAKKAPPEGRAKKRTFTWLSRSLLAALIAAAAALAWLRLPAPAPSDAPKPSASLSAGQTPAPAATQERTAREAAYDKDVAALTALLDSGAADEETRAQAAARLDRLVADHQSELGLEETLNQAGFAPCVVLLQNSALTVIVASSDMTAETSAAILSLCAAHTDIGVENIRIMAREAL